MPVRDSEKYGAFVPMETLPRAYRVAEDHEFQTCWYTHVAKFVAGETVLDAGAGMGYGRRLLHAGGAGSVECFDLVSLARWVKAAKIEDYLDKSFDWVVSMDVIEHVPDDVRFLENMLRVARRHVFFSTPNWLFSGAKNVHHYREYTPEELMTLVDSFHDQWGKVRYWASDAQWAIVERGPMLPADDPACNFGVLIEKV